MVASDAPRADTFRFASIRGGNSLGSLSSNGFIVGGEGWGEGGS